MLRRVLALPLAAAAALLQAPALADEIRFVDGSSQKVEEISEESYDVVKAKVAGTPQTYQTERILEVVHDAFPPAYEDAQKAEKRLDYVAAAAGYARVAESARAGDWVKQYALFHAAECLRHADDLQGARAAYDRLLKEFPKSRFYPHAKLGLGLVDLATGKAGDARKAFKALEDEVGSKRLGEVFRLEAQLHAAQAFEAEGNDGEAQALYGKVAKDAVRRKELARVAYDARVRELAMVGKSNPDRAVKDLLETVDKTDCPPAARALGYNVLGDCYTKLNKPKQALLAYLRVALDRELKQVSTEVPRALYSAAKAFEQTKGPDWKERAESLRKELRESFPSSPWARK